MHKLALFIGLLFALNSICAQVRTVPPSTAQQMSQRGINLYNRAEDIPGNPGSSAATLNFEEGREVFQLKGLLTLLHGFSLEEGIFTLTSPSWEMPADGSYALLTYGCEGSDLSFRLKFEYDHDNWFIGSYKFGAAPWVSIKANFGQMFLARTETGLLKVEARGVPKKRVGAITFYFEEAALPFSN